MYMYVYIIHALTLTVMHSSFCYTSNDRCFAMPFVCLAIICSKEMYYKHMETHTTINFGVVYRLVVVL